MKLILLLVSLLYLALNIAGSQWISSDYFGLVQNQKKAVTSYLKKIVVLPIYKIELNRYKNIYGSGLENDVLKEKIAREQMIKKLEQILQDGSKSRDILYRLYLLYSEEGDKNRAQEYYNRAKELDPNLK